METQEKKSTQEKNILTKSIKVSIKNGDDTKVKVDFRGDVFSPTEFTAMFMAVLETYTASLLETNSKEAVFEHFNRVFGIFLAKLVPPTAIYEKDLSHKRFKAIVDRTLGRKSTKAVKKANEDNRFAAYLLCRDILTKEIGLTEDSADVILNKRLGMVTELVNPKAGMKHGKTDEEG